MPSSRKVGLVRQSMTRDAEGHRHYQCTYLVRTTDNTMGPQALLGNWQLAAVGSAYVEGTDSDPWAFCTPELTIEPHPQVDDQNPCQDWFITQHWSTKQSWRCQTNPIENPLLEPAVWTGGFNHEMRSAEVDKDGNPLMYPNFQPITGPAVEHKYSWPTISISFNSETLPLSTYVLLVNKVNDSTLWGLPPRCIRFIDAQWERKVYGNCFYYFHTTYTFEFDINTFDRAVPAVGTMRLKEGGNHLNPRDFEPAKALASDENVSVSLDEFGREVTEEAGNTQYVFTPKVAQEGDLLLLGIPSTLS